VRLPIPLVVLFGLAGACGPGTPQSAPATSRVWPLSQRTAVVTGPQAMVVSGSPLASNVGKVILQKGGNAVDAAVAVGFALTVVHPEAGNIGGGGFMVIRLKDGSVASLDYRETAPAAATRDMYLDSLGNVTDKSITGHLSVGVPGSVAGMAEAHRRFGKLPWRDVVQPAIALARDGFTVDLFRSNSIRADSARLSRFPASAAAFLPGGKPPAPGTIHRQPELTATLTAIRDRGADGFYRGRVADLLVEEMQRGGGLITHADLEGYRARWRDPVTTRYRGHTIHSMGPASSGGVTLSLILNVMERWDRLPEFGSADLLHFEAEAMRRAFTERNRWLGDPDFVQMPLDRLLSKEYAAELQREIDPARATPTPPFRPTSEGPSTTHYSVVDAGGNAVSTTTTLNNSYGSAVTVTGAGFLLNDEMDDFASAPGKPNMYGLVQGEANAIAPGKRMLSAMTPSIVLDPSGNLLLVVGTPGGPTIITQVYHVISNVIDHRMSLAEAVAAPRMHHQALPDQMRVERGFDTTVIATLQSRGHEVQVGGPMGDIAAIIRRARGWEGVADPRRGGGAEGY
jgi:gamma-glutamyltranspeptidase/glutathione hydrolase